MFRFPACEHAVAKRDELKPWIPGGKLESRDVYDKSDNNCIFRFQNVLQVGTGCQGEEL